MRSKLLVMLNTVAEQILCPLCQVTYDFATGYQVFIQHGDRFALAVDLVCRSCAKQREPALVEMLELHDVYRQFNEGPSSWTHHS
jgi:hypothetical protein